jgi:hypothetical protein
MVAQATQSKKGAREMLAVESRSIVVASIAAFVGSRTTRHCYNPAIATLPRWPGCSNAGFLPSFRLRQFKNDAIFNLRCFGIIEFSLLFSVQAVGATEF